MAHLYFMNRQFEGLCIQWDEEIENGEFQLLFTDSWYWLHYCFFNCRDSVLSEKSSTVRANLYNTSALFLKNLEHLCREKKDGSAQRSPDEIFAVIAELIEIVECSKAFPICLWTFGDETSKSFLEERLATLPSHAQIEELMRLPHFQRIERDRLSYMASCEKSALKRYRNEVAAFNKRLNEHNRTQQTFKCKPAQDLTLVSVRDSQAIDRSTH